MDPILVGHRGDLNVISKLDLSEAPRGVISRYWLHIVTDGMGLPVYVPVIVARGKKEGPTLGLTAALHGNEINGIPVIQRLFREINLDELRGTVVGVLVVNVPSLLRKERLFIDGTDLNHIMPGRADGNVSQVYAYRVVNRIVRYFDYLIDLHTASSGRINSYYIRADMEDSITRQMALLQNAQIIVHNPPHDGTLRGAANALGIPAITLEVGNPHIFQRGLIRDGLTGIHNMLAYLGFLEEEIEKDSELPVICKSSYWLYSDTGGIMTVHPKLVDRVAVGETVASIRDVFGTMKKEYKAEDAGVVVGKSVDPINQTGGRILHLGLIADEDQFETSLDR